MGAPRPSDGPRRGDEDRPAVPRRSLASFLDALEAFYGPQEPGWPTDPYEFLVWWHCGYPPSEERCQRGWARLKEAVGIAPGRLLGASVAKLAAALRPGGMVPELRARRLKELATRVQERFDGDLSSALDLRPADARRELKRFPGIADPGADRILLFAGVEPVPAVPSSCPHVAVRLLDGREPSGYPAVYRRAAEAIASGLPARFAPRRRAYLLLKVHGQRTCTRAIPACDACPVRDHCRYLAASRRLPPAPAGSGGPRSRRTAP